MGYISEYFQFLEESAKHNFLKITGVLVGISLTLMLVNALFFYGEASLFYSGDSFNIVQFLIEGTMSFVNFSLIVVLFTLVVEKYQARIINNQ